MFLLFIEFGGFMTGFPWQYPCPVCPVYVLFTGQNVMRASSRSANFGEDTLRNQIFEISCGCPDYRTGQFTVILVCNSSFCLDMGNSIFLPFRKVHTCQDLIRQPVPPERHHEMETALFEIGLRQARGPAVGNHVRCAGTHFLRVFYPEQGFGDQRVAWYGAMGLTQHVGSETGRQFTGVPHLDAIGKEDDLDKTVMVAVPVGNRIDDGLHDNGTGDLKRNRGLCAFRMRTHPAVDLAKDKLHSLINHFNQSSFIGLLRGDGLSFFRSMEMQTMNLHIVEKSGRILPEKKYGRVGHFVPFEPGRVLDRFLKSRLCGAVRHDVQPLTITSILGHALLIGCKQHRPGGDGQAFNLD